MTDTRADDHLDDHGSPTMEDAADIELPASQCSTQHSPIHDELTVPFERSAGTAKVDNGESISCSESDDDDDDDDSLENDDSCENDVRESRGDDADSISSRLSDSASDDALSFIESSFSNSDSSEGDLSEGGGEDRRVRKRSGGKVCRRRRSNSDSETDESEDDNAGDDGTKKLRDDESDLEQSNGRESDVQSDGRRRKSGDDKSSSKLVSIWDSDTSDFRRSRPARRKLWSDYTYKPEPNQSPGQSRGQTRAGARFTNSFTDRRPSNDVPEPFWGSSPNRNNRFPPQPGRGLGRGLVRNDSRRQDTGSNPRAGGWGQQRRPTNPHWHYQQQQQRYFGMPRGSYASVVQKGPASGGGGGSRRTESGPMGGKLGSGRFGPNQTTHQRQGAQPSPQQEQQQRPVGAPRQHQSYNRGTVTAAQILRQQRLQQSQRQQAQGQRVHQQQQPPPPALQRKLPGWPQVPIGPHMHPLRIGNQMVFVVQPRWERQHIAREDPAIIKVDPPIPQPFIMLPDGTPLSLTGNGPAGGDPRGCLTSGGGGSGGTVGKNTTVEALRKICPKLRLLSRAPGPTMQFPNCLPALLNLNNLQNPLLPAVN